MCLAISLVALACSSKATPPGTEGDGSRLGGASQQGDVGRNNSDKKDGHKKAGSVDRASQMEGLSQNGGPNDIPTQQPAGSFASNGPPSPVDPSLARASSVVEEPEPDGEKSGVAPGYAEILIASIEGLGDNVRFTLTFDGQVPEKMDDDQTFMVIGWSMSMGGDQTYAFSARASDKGWEVFAGAKNESTKLPGTFQVDGDSIVIDVPWSFLDGPRAFRWYTSSSWFRNLAGTTHYIFDAVPNKEAGHFPG
jgi:hypothetical protein